MWEGNQPNSTRNDTAVNAPRIFPRIPFRRKGKAVKYRPAMTDQIKSTERSSKMMIGWLWGTYLKRHWRLLSVALLMMILEGSTFGVLSYMMKPMFDTIFIGGQTDAMWIVGLILFGVFATRAVTSIV